MLNVDVRRFAAVFLRGSDDVERKGSLTGSLGAVYLDDTSAGDAADAEGEVERERTG